MSGMSQPARQVAAAPDLGSLEAITQAVEGGLGLPEVVRAAARALDASLILIDRSSRVVVHGLTGREGSFHGQAMLDYGTQVVAGMTPGKGGQTALDGRVPVFDTVADAVRETGADTSCIFVPAAGAPDAILEASAAGVKTIFCITEGIPTLDMVPVVAAVAAVEAAGYRRVYVDGGRTVHSFLAAGLVSDLTLSRVPVLIGTGHTPFGELPDDLPLEHVRTQTFPGGMVQSSYRVRRRA